MAFSKLGTWYDIEGKKRSLDVEVTVWIDLGSDFICSKWLRASHPSFEARNR
jgi:hypothetical protein